MTAPSDPRTVRVVWDHKNCESIGTNSSLYVGERCDRCEESRPNTEPGTVTLPLAPGQAEAIARAYVAERLKGMTFRDIAGMAVAILAEVRVEPARSTVDAALFVPASTPTEEER